MGEGNYHTWEGLCTAIDEEYEMEHQWNSGSKAWKYEYKYRKGGKTLCSLYAREGCFGFMVIFGKDQREKFEQRRTEFSAKVQEAYDKAVTCHDGKWLMFMPEDLSLLVDFMELLEMKRKPNRK